jgi:hypothetical protein
MGIQKAVDSLKHQKFELKALPPIKKTVANVLFIPNAHRDVDLGDLIEHLEHRCGIKVTRALVDPLDPFAKTASAHVEFDSTEDAKTVLDTCNKDGLIYRGRALRASHDRNTPKWEKANPLRLYSSKNTEDHPEVLSDDGSYMDEKKDDCGDFTSKANTTFCSTETGHSFENMNVLFGDNLLMLYEQGIALSRASEADTRNEKTSTSPLQQDLVGSAVGTSGEAGAKKQEEQEVTLLEIPDLLWD